MSFYAPNLDYKGNPGVIITDYGSLKVDKKGLATCTAVFKTKQASWLSLPRLSAVHPIFGFIGVDSFEISFNDGWAISTVNYAGLDPTSRDKDNEDESTPVYELVFGLSEEPIETHPDFVAKIGGTAKEPKNLATFSREAKTGGVERIARASDPEKLTNAGYVFKEFETFDAAGNLNRLAKVSSYLNANQITWKKSFTRKTSISQIKKGGHIDEPQGPYPDFGDEFGNWLNMGTTQTQKGIAFTCSTEWRYSGRRGWDKDIYGITPQKEKGMTPQKKKGN